MPVRSLNALRVFEVVARNLSFSRAAEHLSMSQGAVSYQIRRLEDELGFELFDRSGRAVRMTEAGLEFKVVATRVLAEIDETAMLLRRREQRELVIGVSTYFGSRWLSPRLMRFIVSHPNIILRFQAMVGQIELAGTGVDVAVVWGSKEHFAAGHELLLESNVTPMCGRQVAETLTNKSLDDWLSGLTLIHDDETRDAWQKWLSLAGLSDKHGRRGPLIPDPNMRVQAVIDGQGLALFDDLVGADVRSGSLVVPTNIELGGYGYFLSVSPYSAHRQDVAALLEWLRRESLELLSA